MGGERRARGPGRDNPRGGQDAGHYTPPVPTHHDGNPTGTTPSSLGRAVALNAPIDDSPGGSRLDPPANRLATAIPHPQCLVLEDAPHADRPHFCGAASEKNGIAPRCGAKYAEEAYWASKQQRGGRGQSQQSGGRGGALGSQPSSTDLLAPTNHPGIARGHAMPPTTPQHEHPSPGIDHERSALEAVEAVRRSALAFAKRTEQLARTKPSNFYSAIGAEYKRAAPRYDPIATRMDKDLDSATDEAKADESDGNVDLGGVNSAERQLPISTDDEGANIRTEQCALDMDEAPPREYEDTREGEGNPNHEIMEGNPDEDQREGMVPETLFAKPTLVSSGR